MPGPHELLLFILAGVLLNLTPGPDVLYIVSSALRAGVRAGLAAAVGVAAGCLVHVTAAALGVSALLAASASAFTLLKYAGAAYLLWLGARILVAGGAAPGPDLAALAATAGARPLKKVFGGGFLTNVLNPKVALFFLAFVPQFIAPAAPDKALAFMLLGLVFTANTVLLNSCWALAAAWLARRGAVRGSLRWLDRAAGCLFIGFGLKLALSDNPSLTGG